MSEVLFALLSALIVMVGGYGEIERRRIVKALKDMDQENNALKETIKALTTGLKDAEDRHYKLRSEVDRRNQDEQRKEEVRTEEKRRTAIMYDLLDQAHQKLQTDHNLLKGEFDQTRSEWETTKRERDAERKKNAEALAQNHDLFEANKKLAATLMSYEQAFKLLGQKLQAGTPDSAESKPASPAPDPEAGQESLTSEEKQS